MKASARTSSVIKSEWSMRMSLAHSPVSVRWHGGREVAEVLQGIDFFLKAVPQTGPERLNRFHMTLLFLPEL